MAHCPTLQRAPTTSGRDRSKTSTLLRKGGQFAKSLVSKHLAFLPAFWIARKSLRANDLEAILPIVTIWLFYAIYYVVKETNFFGRKSRVRVPGSVSWPDQRRNWSAAAVGQRAAQCWWQISQPAERHLVSPPRFTPDEGAFAL